MSAAVQYRFLKVEHPHMVANDRVLECPRCRETLVRADIEGFSACPFCSYRFASTVELEDFIMEPAVDSWMREQPGFTFHILSNVKGCEL
ncbi:MAG: hypothetical protein MR727_06255 [Lentisphaeria bacterium]|nr:hypothetical protein [Lentisphaeria bacterium]